MARNAIAVEKSGPRLPFEVHAYQSFVVGLKLFWTRSIYERVAREAKALDLDDPRAIEREMRKSVLYQYYGWLEHYLQQYKFLGRWGLMSVLERQDERLAAILDEYAREAPERLRLDPDLQLPKYYVQGDFHQMPGGIWSDACDAFAYELGSQTTTPTHAHDADLHTRYARYVKALCNPRRILDEGCGFRQDDAAAEKDVRRCRGRRLRPQRAVPEARARARRRGKASGRLRPVSGRKARLRRRELRCGHRHDAAARAAAGGGARKPSRSSPRAEARRLLHAARLLRSARRRDRAVHLLRPQRAQPRALHGAAVQARAGQGTGKRGLHRRAHRAVRGDRRRARQRPRSAATVALSVDVIVARAA
jgi:hypothetical protein